MTLATAPIDERIRSFSSDLGAETRKRDELNLRFADSYAQEARDGKDRSADRTRIERDLEAAETRIAAIERGIRTADTIRTTAGRAGAERAISEIESRRAARIEDYQRVNEAALKALDAAIAAAARAQAVVDDDESDLNAIREARDAGHLKHWSPTALPAVAPSLNTLRTLRDEMAQAISRSRN